MLRWLSRWQPRPLSTIVTRAGLELPRFPGYYQPTTSPIDLKSGSFFEGVHRVPLAIGAVGACLFLAAFAIQGVDGLGRAVGLCGISIVLCAVAVNLLLQLAGLFPTQHTPRHLVAQALLATCMAVAVLCLAGYVYRYGTLPSFLPTRYESRHQG